MALKHDDALRLADKMLEIRDYLHSDHIYKEKILQMLYADLPSFSKFFTRVKGVSPKAYRMHR